MAMQAELLGTFSRACELGCRHLGNQSGKTVRRMGGHREGGDASFIVSPIGVVACNRVAPQHLRTDCRLDSVPFGGCGGGEGNTGIDEQMSHAVILDDITLLSSCSRISPFEKACTAHTT